MAEHKMPESTLPGSNSLISRQEFKAEPTSAESKPASSARVETPKKSFRQKCRESFVGNDVQTVGDYLFFSVLIPSIKRTIFSIINTGSSMFLLQGTPQNDYSFSQRGVNYTPYNNVVRRNGGYSSVPMAMAEDSPAGTLKNISWATEDECADVLNDLLDCIYHSNNHEVTVAKYYILSRVPGLRTNPSDDQWGWTNLQGVTISRHPQMMDRWIINLPRPVFLR